MAYTAEHREAVIAIQGGGLHGLTLIGQLQAVLEDHRYVPLAFAGTSAGAIVATLAWAGVSPRDIHQMFHQLASANRLLPLLAPYSPTDFDFAKFRNQWKELEDFLQRLTESDGGILNRGKAAWKALSLWKGIAPHFQKRGFFFGGNLERQIERWLRAQFAGIERFAPKGQPIRFRNIAEFIEAKKTYHPPLLLTVTNLTQKRIEIVSSIDPNYDNVPVAKAVRASAGYPVFLTPSEIRDCPRGEISWFVDGGVIANFPIWMFSDALRMEIQESALEHIYGHLVNKPWIRIGLGILDDSTEAPDLSKPAPYFHSLFRMLTGGTRNALEDKLIENAPRSIPLKQPSSTTGLTVDDFLRLDAITAAQVDDMVLKGRNWANARLKELGSPSANVVEGARERVTKQLKELVQKCDLIFGGQSDCTFRANVFMPIRAGNDARMRLLFSVNMSGDSDENLEFPDLQSGATGFCYWSRRPQVCNLERIAKLRETDPKLLEKMFGNGPLFGMNDAIQNLVRRDRSWLSSVPIFDPQEVRLRPANRAAQPRKLKHVGEWYVELETEIEGPLLGVLNLDAGWSYPRMGLDEDPHKQFQDRRVQAVLAIMQATSFGIAKSLGGDFPR